MEIAMIKSFIAHLMSFLRFNYKNHDEQMLIWAKTEYGKDWQYAYTYVLPKIVKKGKF